jgi:hypothetical protein
MNITPILSKLAAEKASLSEQLARVQQAITQLSKLSGRPQPRGKRKKRKPMSQAAKRKISMALRKAWKDPKSKFAKQK